MELTLLAVQVSDYWGEITGLLAALSWAITSLVFVKVRATAAALNFYKNGLSCGFLFLTVAFYAIHEGSFMAGSPALSSDAAAWLWLLGSAVFGLVIGDVSYFRSLQILGPRRCLLLTTLAPPMGALIAWPLLGETLSLVAWGGMAMTLGGIAWVVRERTATSESPDLYPGSVTLGVVHGAISSFGQAFGAVCSKKAMLAEVSPLDATALRMLVAVVIIAVIARFRGSLGAWLTGFTKRETWAPVIPASFLGTYIGVWLCLVSYRFTEIGIATTMQSMSPIFVIPLIVLFWRQRVSLRALIGALVAVAGVALLFVEA